MELEFIDNNIIYEREKRFSVKYKERMLRNPYAADFVAFDSIILEIKSVSAIIESHPYQTLSYLSVAEKKLGMVINFGEKSPTLKRIVF